MKLWTKLQKSLKQRACVLRLIIIQGNRREVQYIWHKHGCLEENRNTSGWTKQGEFQRRVISGW